MSPSMQRKVLALFLTMLAGALSAGETEIRIKPDAVISGPFVLLGDIAEVQCDDADQSASLKNLELFPAPSPGRSRTIRAFELRQLLELHDFKTQSMRIAGTGSARVAGPSRLAASITDEPRTATPVGIPAPRSAESRGGRLTNPERSMAGAVVVAKRAITPGDTIREIDVELFVPQKPILGANVARSTESVTGMEAMRPFAPGQVIDVSSLRKPVLVQRGQAITVIAKAAGVRVRTTARALDNGGSGDVILLESIETKQKYSAVVTGPQQAEVLASGTTVSDRAPRPAELSHVGATGSGVSRIGQFPPFGNRPESAPTEEERMR